MKKQISKKNIIILIGMIIYVLIYLLGYIYNFPNSIPSGIFALVYAIFYAPIGIFFMLFSSVLSFYIINPFFSYTSNIGNIFTVIATVLSFLAFGIIIYSIAKIKSKEKLRIILITTAISWVILAVVVYKVLIGLLTS